MTSEWTARLLKDGRVAVVGSTYADRVLFTANGMQGQWISLRRTDGEPVACWAASKFCAAQAHEIVRRHNAVVSEQAEQARGSAVLTALHVAARAWRNDLGHCEDCDDGRCCGHCTCCL